MINNEFCLISFPKIFYINIFKYLRNFIVLSYFIFLLKQVKHDIFVFIFTKDFIVVYQNILCLKLDLVSSYYVSITY